MNLRKKVLALVLMGCMLFTAGCGSNNSEATSAESEQTPVETLDLEGSWIAEVQDSGYYLAGFIKGDLIELHWVSSYDQYGSVYWAGSYGAPKDDPDTYTWESERDDDIMATTAYGSSDETRTFTYADGKLTLEGSATGAETVLIPSDIDYTYLAVDLPESDDDDDKDKDKNKDDKDSKDDDETTASDAEAAANEKVKDIEVLDTGYIVEDMDGGNSLIYYAVEIKNPNKYNAIVSPNIEITVRDKNERVLTKQNCSLSAVAPGDTLCFGDSINCPKGKPDKVEITVENNDYDFTAFAGSGLPSVKDLAVSDIDEKKSKGSTTFTGTVTNNMDDDMEGVIATIVFKNGGKIIGGVSEKIGTIEAGGTVDFNISAKSGFKDFDSYEVFALQEPE